MYRKKLSTKLTALTAEKKRFYGIYKSTKSLKGSKGQHKQDYYVDFCF